jgi:threonylcarbamoyladenosine tRNA methylthiotransferase MtaB
VPDLEQLRLSSIDAIEIDEALFDLLANEPRIAPHLHLSFQSGDDMILKRMKRRHSRADAINLCHRLRDARPVMAFGADLIAGFPTETDAMFANTLASVDECGIDYLHVFPYSPRPQTPAAKMPQVARDVVKARAALLRQKGGERLALRLGQHVGQTAMALVEAGGRARLSNFAPVRIDGASPEPGRPARFNLVSRTATELVGVPA